MKDPAAGCILGLNVAADNYKQALDTLVQRYGNKQLLISTHIDQLLSIKPILNLYDVKKLRESFDKIESNVRNLKTLNVDAKQYGPVLASIIMSKLPNEICLLISRAMPLNREWDVEIVMNHFQRELEPRDRSGFLASTNLETRGQRYQQNETYTTSALFAVTSCDTRERQVSCAYCRNNHLSHKCNMITDPRARKAILRNKAKCFVYLKSGHRAVDCNSKGTRFKCKQRHHISICKGSVSSNNGSFQNQTRAPQGDRSGCYRGEIGPVAMETFLGSVLSGNTGVRGSSEYVSTHVLKVSCVGEVSETTRDNCLIDSFKQFWQIEEASERGVTDNDLHDQFSKSIRFKNKHYVVKLLWKQDNNNLSDN